MANAGKCLNCDGRNQYENETAANGGYGPLLLQGLRRSVFTNPRMRVIVCADCGHMQMFASNAAMEQLAASARWTRVNG